ncbi:MAG: type VI secretion system baseplate subunit TssE [Bacteroidota bacterium]
MKPGLFEMVEGRFHDGRPLSGVVRSEYRIQSIISNLNRLFNTRRGSIQHLPDYGLPDLSTVYRDMPYSLEGLRRTVRLAVEQYEPRLRRVRVTQPDGEGLDPIHLRIRFIVTGDIARGERVEFETRFEPQGGTQVDLHREY